MRGIRTLFALLAFALAAAACTSEGNGSIQQGINTNFAAQMASSWHYVGAPQRFQVGIVASDANGRHFVTQGSIDVAFAYLGADGGGDPEQGPTATATYLPVPGTDGSGAEPVVSDGAKGVYEADGVAFDRAGVWRATVSAQIDGVAREISTDFPVTEESAIPAPGMPALRTENLTFDSRGVPAAAIDSLAVAGEGIPDRELHEWTIAEAITRGRPALVLFGTPAFCESQFCGPEVAELQRLAAAYPDRAVYIHVEIWQDYDARPQVINEAAADWLLRGGNMTEPWLFLVGADGIIADRWGPLFDAGEVAAALEALPPMGR